MRWLSVPFLVAALAVPTLAPAQKALFPTGKTEVEVPVDLTSGYIYVPTTVNGKKLRMVFDTGAGLNCLTPETAKTLGVELGQVIPVGGAGSARVEGHLSKLKSIEIGGARVEDVPVLVLSLPKVLECDGLVGFPFYSQFVSTVDYARAKLRLTSPSAYVPALGSTEVPMRTRANSMQVEAEVEGAKGWFTIDTGAGGNLVLFNHFVEENKWRDKHPTRLRTMTGKGVGGMVQGELLHIDGVKLGPMALPRIVADYSLETAGAFANPELAGNIGYDVLRRFTVSFDIAHQRMVLEKNRDFESESLTNRSGLIMDFDGTVNTVVFVIPGSPADKAGIKAGDVLVSYEGMPTKSFRAVMLRRLTRGLVGDSMALVLRNAEGKEYKADLQLADLVPR